MRTSFILSYSVMSTSSLLSLPLLFTGYGYAYTMTFITLYCQPTRDDLNTKDSQLYMNVK